MMTKVVKLNELEKMLAVDLRKGMQFSIGGQYYEIVREPKRVGVYKIKFHANPIYIASDALGPHTMELIVAPMAIFLVRLPSQE